MIRKQPWVAAIVMAGAGACATLQSDESQDDSVGAVEQPALTPSVSCQTWTSADLHTASAGRCSAPISSGTFRVKALFCTQPNCNWVVGPYMFINGGTSSVTRTVWATQVTWEPGPAGG